MKLKLSFLKKYITPLILGIVSFFILRTIFSYSTPIENSINFLSWQTVLVSAVALLGYFYLRAISWHFTLKALQANVEVKKTLPTWFLGESTRYVPGSVWSFLSRVVLAKKEGIPKSITVVSLLIEVLMVVAITGLFSIPAFIFSIKTIQFDLTLVLIISLALLLILLVLLGFKNKILNVFNRLQKFPIQNISWNYFGLSIFFQVLCWFFYAVGSIVFINSGSNFYLFLSIAIFAWLIGYLSFITPSGFGIREAALILLLTPFLGIGKATFVALFGRILLVLVELLNVLFWAYKIQKSKVILLVKKAFSRWDLIILTVLILIYAIGFSILTIMRHDAFSSNFDLANMDQTVWNTLHGRLFTLTSEMGATSRLSIHADFILMFLAPLYLIWDNVRMLLISQSVVLSLGAIPTYLLAKKILNSRIIGLIMAALYLLNPSMQWVNIYDFHGVALAIPLLLAAFYCAYSIYREKNKVTIRKYWIWYSIFAILALFCKEEIGVILALMGVAMFFIFRQGRMGLITFLVGAIWFPLMVFVVIPHYSPTGEHWAFDSWFKAPKDTVEQNGIMSMVPKLSGYFLTPTAYEYYMELLKPFSFLPLLGLPWILLSGPELGINMLSNNGFMQSIHFHYTSGIIPGLVISTIFSLRYIQWIADKIIPKPSKKYAQLLLLVISFGTLVLAIRVNYHYSPLPSTPSCWCFIYDVDNDDRTFEQILQNIPEKATVSASGEVRAHLTHRENVNNLPTIPVGTDYIAMIDQERSVGAFDPHPFEIELANKLQSSPSDYILETHIGHFYLFKNVHSAY